MKILRIITCLFALFVLTACPGSKDEPEKEQENLSSAKLVFPENNSACTAGENRNHLESTITFLWEVSANTDSYQLNVRNLDLNSTEQFEVMQGQASVTLVKNVPYEWFVVSKRTNGTTQVTSDKWRFYNAGDGEQNYAPFPATAIRPGKGQTINNTGTVTLEWSGSDIDSDIDGYQLFFGTDKTTMASLGTTAQNTMNAATGPGQTYYWRVGTTDKFGNSSQSDVFTFKVQ